MTFYFNELGLHLNSAEGMKLYDALIKNIIADSQIIAYIIKYCTSEFRDLPIREIMERIESIDQESVPLRINELVRGENTEDISISEGNVYFDYLVKVKTPDEENVRIYINIEGQNDLNRTYDLSERAIYYASRIISRQGDNEFSLKDSDYHNIRKVYSIWICPDPPKYLADHMISFHFEQELIYGEKNPQLVSKLGQMRYDLIEVVTLYLSDNVDVNNSLLGMLNVLFSRRVSLDTKETLLKKNYDIDTRYGAGEGFNDMNLGEGLYNTARLRTKIEATLEARQKIKTMLIEELDFSEEEADKKVEKLYPYEEYLVINGHDYTDYL